MGSNYQNQNNTEAMDDRNRKISAQNKAIIIIMIILIIVLLGFIGITAYNITQSKQGQDKDEPKPVESAVPTKEPDVTDNDIPTESIMPVESAVPTKEPDVTDNDIPTETITPVESAVPTKEPKETTSPVVSVAEGTDVESYVSGYVRPMYNHINKNINNCKEYTVGSATIWHDGKGTVKKQYTKGSDGYNMSRQYYYDSDNGDLIFAFIFDGKKENRLYFMNDRLVRYIGPSGKIIDNAVAPEAMDIVQRVLDEAYKDKIE